MATYTAYGNTFDPVKHSLGLRFRVNVTAERAFMTGEAYHRVKIEAKDIAKDILGNWVGSAHYEKYAEGTVHCCCTAKEAAEYYASKYGLKLA